MPAPALATITLVAASPDVRFPSIDGLRAFEAAARLGSFERAADELAAFHAALAPVAEGADPFAGLGKVAALGIKVTRHCAYHGLALNVAMDLEPFGRIDPCGYAGLKTVDLRSIGVAASWDEVAQALAARLRSQLAP